MPTAAPQPSPDGSDRLAQLEARVARLEAYVGLAEQDALHAAVRELVRPTPRSADELEQEVGQNWFGPVGITALAVGGGYMLTLPYPGVPAGVPSVAGLIVAGLLFGLAHAGRRSFALVSSYLRAAAMALLYCAMLRLFYFGAASVLRADTIAGVAVLSGASAANLVVAWQRKSARLGALALLTACVTPLAVNAPAVVLPGCLVLAVLTAVAGSQRHWHWLLPLGAGLTFLTYLIWAAGNPMFGHAYHWSAAPASAPLFLLASVAIIGAAPLSSRSVAADEPAVAVSAFLGCTIGYGGFLVHTYAAGTPRYVLLHGAASVVLLLLAAALWLRHRSQWTTFFYAMGGYAALSIAIVRATPVPDVMVWLSVESVVVVATAIWFRSRFIVVANFAIYVLVVLGYMALNERETGVSLGFGIVALVSARVLNWQRHRLALKTELMRNAYLVSAFAIFPYALYHLVAGRFVALAWVGLAIMYYALNRIIRNQKYRWMAHGTLLLTAIYLLIPGRPGLTPGYRIASFLALGIALLVVSLTFTQARRRASAGGADNGLADANQTGGTTNGHEGTRISAQETRR